jgi:WD40 repeat protein
MLYMNNLSDCLDDCLPTHVVFKKEYVVLKNTHILGNQLLQHSDLITSLKWSPCGDYLASCGHDGLLRVWDSKSFQLVQEYSTNHEQLQGLEWTSNSLGIIFIDNDGCIYRFSIINSQIEWTTKLTPYVLTSLYLDKEIAYCADCNGHIHKCNLETGLHMPSHNQVSQGAASVYSSLDERYLMRLEKEEYCITDVDNPSRVIAVGSEISILSSNPNRLLVSWEGGEALFQCWPTSIKDIFKGQGESLVCCNVDGTISVLSNLDLRLIVKTSFGEEVPVAGCLLVNSEEIVIAFSSGIIRVLRLQNLSVVSEIRVTDTPLVSICQINDYIAVGGTDSNIYIIEYKEFTRQIAILSSHFWHVTALAQCQISGRLASGSKDYSIRIWESNGDIFHETPVRTFGSTDYVEALCWINDAEILSGSQDGRVIIWNIENGGGQLLHTMRGWVTNISCLTNKFTVIIDNKNQGIYGYLDEKNHCIVGKCTFTEDVITSFVYCSGQMEIACVITLNGLVYTYSESSSDWKLCQSNFSKEMIKRISISMNGRFACILRESFVIEIWSISLVEKCLILKKEREIIRPPIDVTCLSIANNGFNVCIGGWSRYLELYYGSKLQAKVPMSETVRCVSYTQDEKFQIIAAWNGSFALVNADSQLKEVGAMNRGRGLSVATYTSRGGENLIAFGNADTTVTIYKLDSPNVPC